MVEKIKEHSVGKTIAALRKEKGYTQVELAEKLGVSDKAVSKWESEAGFPEITQLPVLADIFGVTIDYLMIGKEPEEKIVLMSKAELCAKNDDISLLEEIKNVDHKDEKGFSLLDYIKQYNSKKVLTTLIDINARIYYSRSGVDEIQILKWLKYIIPINKEQKFLSGIIRTELRLVGDFGFTVTPVSRSNESRKEMSELYLEIFEWLVSNYDSMPQEQKDYYFELDGSDELYRNSCWSYAYPYFIDIAYRKNKNLFIKLINRIEKSNESYRNKVKELKDRYGSYYNEHWREKEYLDESIANVVILQSTIETALSQFDFENVYLLNKINKECKGFVVDDKSIAIARMKNDKTKTEDEIFVFSCMENGILILNDLLKSSDKELIIRTIQNKPIHKIELVYGWYKKNNWKELYQFAVDNSIAVNDFLKNKMNDAIVTLINSLWNNPHMISNKQYMKLESYNGISPIYRVSVNVNNIDECFEKIMKFIQDIKNRLIEETKLKYAFANQSSELTKEFFLQQLSNGAVETVIIKLCVRLEAYLRRTYSDTQSDFFYLINKYCSTFNTNDDEGNDCNPVTPRLLQKLRIHRNSLVHPEEKGDLLSVEELKDCIAYICSLN